jgi:hypothetical protein
MAHEGNKQAPIPISCLFHFTATIIEDHPNTISLGLYITFKKLKMMSIACSSIAFLEL